MNRYFIASGATANWNDISSWSETSGGAVGASIPTSVDNAIFDANSLSAPCNLTINAEANCLDLDFSGLDNLLTVTNSAYNLNVYGNLTLTSNTFLATAFSGTGYLQLRATTSVNITSNGCTRGWNKIYFDGVGGTWTIQDDMNTVAFIYMINGTLIGDNKTITTGTIRVEYNIDSIFTLNIPNSVLNINGYIYAVGYLNVTALNSVININGGSICQFFRTTGTLNIVNLINVGNCGVQVNCLELTYTGNSVLLFRNSKINKLKINGTNSTIYRCLITSESLSGAILECDSLEFSNVDFRDIVGAGTANWDLSAITGGSGDCGGNSGITFTPAENVYHYRAAAGGSNWSTENLWFKGTGGTGGASRVPLPQDTAIFDANTFPAGSNSVYLNVPRIGSVNMSGVDKAFTFILGNAFECYGSFILSPNVTNSGGSTVTFRGRGNHSINTFGKLFYGGLVVETIGGVYTLQSNFANSLNPFYINSGTFDANDYSLDLSGLFRSKQTGSVVYLGNAEHIFRFSSNDHQFYGTVYFEGSTLTFSPTGSSICQIMFNQINLSVNKINKIKLTGDNTSYFSINRIYANELIVDAGRIVKIGDTIEVAKLTSNGTPPNKITLQSNVPGTQITINYTGLDTPFIPNVVLKDINFTVPVYALNGTNLGNNTNVKYVWSVAKKTMGFPIRLVKD